MKPRCGSTSQRPSVVLATRISGYPFVDQRSLLDATCQFVDWTSHPLPAIGLLSLPAAVAVPQRLTGSRRLEPAVSDAACLQRRDYFEGRHLLSAGTANKQVFLEWPARSAPHFLQQGERKGKLKKEKKSFSGTGGLKDADRRGAHPSLIIQRWSCLMANA